MPRLNQFSRTALERQIVSQYLPIDTQEMQLNGVRGYVYDITSEIGDQYTMFLFHDGSLYQVMVVFPEVAGHYSPADGHLYKNGMICLNQEHGYRDLELAFSKSVLWATGFSIYLQTGSFPF